MSHVNEIKQERLPPPEVSSSGAGPPEPPQLEVGQGDSPSQQAYLLQNSLDVKLHISVNIKHWN